MKLLKSLARSLYRIVLYTAVGYLLLYAYSSFKMEYTINVGALLMEDKYEYSLKGFFIKYIVDNNDTVILNIDSPGGSTAVAQEFIHDIRMSKGYIITRVDRYAASAAALIMLTGDRIEAKPNARILFHRAYFTVMGLIKINPPDTRHLAVLNDLAANRIMPLLSPDQQIAYIMGRDVVLTGQEVIYRLNIQARSGNYPLLPQPFIIGGL